MTNLSRPVFHLSLPVRDLAASRAFYVELLGAATGREREGWFDVVFFGHQLTLQLAPDEVPADAQPGVRHFGAILSWSEWEALGARLVAQGAPIVHGPEVTLAGSPREQGKLYLADPDGHVIEIKAYRDLAGAGLGWIEGLDHDVRCRDRRGPV